MDGSWVLARNPDPQVIQPRFIVQGPPPTRLRYPGADASIFWDMNRRVSVAVEVLKRWFDTPPPWKQDRTVALSMIRGQAGAAGIIPPDTTRIPVPLPPLVGRGQPYYPPGSDFLPIPTPLRLDYDPFGGGAFFATPARSKSDRIIDLSGVKPIQILPIENDLQLRHWVIQSMQTRGVAYYPENTQVRRPPLPLVEAIAITVAMRLETPPPWRANGPTYLVDAGKFYPIPKPLMPNGTGAYDIYHYYVG